MLVKSSQVKTSQVKRESNFTVTIRYYRCRTCPYPSPMGPTSSPLASGEPSARLGRAQDGRAVDVSGCADRRKSHASSLNRTPRTRGRLVELKPSALLKSRFRNPVLIETSLWSVHAIEVPDLPDPSIATSTSHPPSVSAVEASR